MTITTLNYARAFGGVSRLYGTEALSRLKSAHVAVAGLGGVGSWVAEALARSGVGALTLIDLDNVSESNINRQLPALVEHFGRPKTEVMRERVRAINPAIAVTALEDFVDAENLGAIFKEPFTFVVDAIDDVKIKALMVRRFLQTKQAFALSGGAGGKTRASRVKAGDLSAATHDRLLATLRYRLRKEGVIPRRGKTGVFCVYSTEEVTLPEACAASALENGLACAGYGSSMVVTATFAMMLAEAAIAAIVDDR